MQLCGVLTPDKGVINLHYGNFKRLVEATAPDRDPDSGVRKYPMFLDPETEQAMKPNAKKKAGVKNGKTQKMDEGRDL
jgi:hypothetical protein